MARDDDLDPVRRLDRVEWRVDALDLWRKHTVDPSLVRHEDRLREIVKADEIADAVVHAIGSRTRYRFAWWQTLSALLVGAAAISDFILRVTGHG